jgi:hypothetical protein
MQLWAIVRERRTMKPRAVALGLGIVVAILASSSGVASGQTPEPSERRTIVRVYYADLATCNQIIIAFEGQLMETNYAEGYHILEVTPEDMQKLLAVGLRVEVDETWKGPGSFSEIPPEAEPTRTPNP